MPVRIYDIAKKLGLESKFVLIKAKELGIAQAKVPSSTLDKITAEFLESQFVPAAPAEPAPAGPAPVQRTAEATLEAAAPPFETVSTPVEPDSEPFELAAAPAGEPPAAPAVEPPPPPAVLAEPAIPAVPPTAVEPPEPALARTPEPAPVPPPPPPVPPSPPESRIPGRGDLIGRIELPLRQSRPGGGLPPASPPAARRNEPPRGIGRPGDRGPLPGRGHPGALPPPRQAAVPAPLPKPAAKPSVAVPTYAAPQNARIISLKPPIIVRDLAEKLGIKPFRLIGDLMELKVFATVNQALDEKVAQYIAAKHGAKFEVEKREKGAGQVHAPVKPKVALDEDQPEDLKPRAPVITIMGHVDHGKTTLLDVIRKSDVAANEAGGITQHIGAYTIQVPHPEKPGELQQLTFLDTPGHAAFSAMRARGANVTDIVILVVSAAEGIMPQTLEALNHAKAAKVPIMVAVTKMDLPAANPLRVRQQLQEKGLVTEEWGGDTIFVDVAATKREGIDQLLSLLVLQADVMELKANPVRRAIGNVIESGLEPGGPTATVLVRRGTLKLGDVMVCGPHYGRTKALINEEGQRLKEAGPSVAVKVLGLSGVPEAGLEFDVIANERAAREICEEREQAGRAEARAATQAKTVEELMRQIQASHAKILHVVVKGDTQGSVEAIVDALGKLDSTKVTLDIMHSAVGTISESDVVLASTAQPRGLVLGFHTRMDTGVSASAKREGVLIKQYEIIYELIDETRDAMAGMLDPELREVTVGSAEVRQVFALSKGGNVAGCMVTGGRIVRGKARLVRRKEVIHDGIIQTLRRFQDEVNEVRAGLECGIRISSWDALEPGDLIESYTLEKVKQQL
ncbi:MAG: translation initiation factor IF-2 [Limisphaerales bacterium]